MLQLSAQELTEVDIVKLKDFDARKASVFGFSLGMSTDEAMAVIKANPKLTFKIEDWHSDSSYRIYVNHADIPDPGKNILYLIWWNKQKTHLNQISIFEAMNQFLVGDTRRLQTTEVFDSTSVILNAFLGKCDSSAVTLNVPIINYKHETYYYYSRGIEVTKKIDSYADPKIVGTVLVNEPLKTPKISAMFSFSDFTQPKKK